MTEFQNPSFYSYTYDGPNPNQVILDGGGDMYDNGNIITPWFLSGALYNINTGTPNASSIFYNNTTETNLDTSFYYVSLGLVYPFTVLGYRLDGPVGWQVAGNGGADGGGSLTNGYIYNGTTVNGFTVYAGYRLTYNAGDPSICQVIILLGHPNWSSVFGPITFTPDTTTTDTCGMYMYSGSGSKSILAVYTLLSKPSGVAVTVAEMQTSITNLTFRLSQQL